MLLIHILDLYNCKICFYQLLMKKYYNPCKLIFQKRNYNSTMILYQSYNNEYILHINSDGLLLSLIGLRI